MPGLLPSLSRHRAVALATVAVAVVLAVIGHATLRSQRLVVVTQVPRPSPAAAAVVTHGFDGPTEANDAGAAVVSVEAGRKRIARFHADGNSAAAAQFAAAAPFAFRRDLLNAAYYEWARREPELAVQSALKVDGRVEREFAVESALAGWARSDPAALADAALRFPDGEEKTAALTKAFRAWMVRDPQQAGDWLSAHPAQLAIAEEVFRNENR